MGASVGVVAWAILIVGAPTGARSRDLYNVADMYRAGQIRPEIERYSMDDALEAYRRLESGELSGRAVVTPHA